MNMNMEYERMNFQETHFPNFIKLEPLQFI